MLTSAMKKMRKTIARDAARLTPTEKKIKAKAEAGEKPRRAAGEEEKEIRLRRRGKREKKRINAEVTESRRGNGELGGVEWLRSFTRKERGLRMTVFRLW